MRVAVLSLGFCLASPWLAHADWPQWRGPARDGSVSNPSPDQWAERAVLLWEKDVGEGYSGPVVSGNRVWVHTRRDHQEIVSSLSLDTGELLWSRRYDAPFRQDPTAIAHGRGPYSTPALADGRLFTLGVTSILLAWDAETGRLLWKSDYSKELDPSYMVFGAAASPLVWGNLCFAPFGTPEGRKPGSPGHGLMVALNVRDGTEVWRWANDASGAGASPVIRQIAGCWQLVFKSKQHIVGVDALSGQELWRIPYKVPMYNTIVTPLFLGDRLVTSDYQSGFRAWRIHRTGDTWATRRLWRRRDASLFTSSPVVVGNQVVGFADSRKGHLFGLDPANGRVVWRGAPRSGEHASLIAWGEHVLVLLEDGSLLVGAVGETGFRLLRRYHVGRFRMWGHPAVVGDRIVVKDGSRLAVYRLGEP